MSACLCVCVCVCLSVCPRGYLQIDTVQYLLKFLCMLTMAVAWSSTGRVMKYKDNGQFWGFSSPVTMHFTVLHLGPIQNG